MSWFILYLFWFVACSTAKVTLGNDGSATGTNNAGCSPVAEVCNGVDDDCDGDKDEEATDALTWYPDRDDDGYGDPNYPATSCTQPAGYILQGGDCDDTDGLISPDGTEICNGYDDNCDNLVDDQNFTVWYADVDDDSYGDPESTREQCEQPEGYVGNGLDCDDTDADISPTGYEVYYDIASPGSGILNCSDGVDNDCDGAADSADMQCADEDADGIPDGVDYLFPCDPDGDGVDEAACLRSDMLWVSPWDSVDCIQQENDFTTLSTSGANALVGVTWGGETFDVCPIYPTSISTSIDARAVSWLGTDGVSVVDTSDCGDWVPANLSVYCEDWPDNLCTTKTSSDGCETVGKVISFAYDGTQVTP